MKDLFEILIVATVRNMFRRRISAKDKLCLLESANSRTVHKRRERGHHMFTELRYKGLNICEKERIANAFC